MKKDSILENNIVQTIGSAGESLAAGAIFTLPAIFMWASEGKCDLPSFFSISLIALCGGLLGVFFMVPLRSALIVEEHGTLPYPEGMACAEVLLAGEKGGAKSKTVFSGLLIAAVYKFVADGLKVFPSEIEYQFTGYRSAIGLDVLPALAGVGYICGPKISSYMFTGGIISWFVMIPMISFFGGSSPSVVMDADNVALAFNQLTTAQIWGNYIRYIGAGAVACGGIISLIKTFPTIIRTFKKAVSGLGKERKDTSLRTGKDLPMAVLLVGIVAVALVLFIMPSVPVNLLGALIIVVFGFFFATVSSRMVGIVGSSNNPVSGMAIATLIVTTLLLKASGKVGMEGMIAAISIGSVICVIAALAGDMSQDLKTGYIVGATPKYQQIGEIIGVVAAALTIAAVMYLLNSAWSFGSKEIPAPQATLMKMVVEGVMGGTLPWVLIGVGAFIAIAVNILGIPVLAFAIGVYLPIHLTAAIMVGGLVRAFMEKRKKYKSDEEKNEHVQNGVLYSAGMIAGEGIVGIVLAILAVCGVAGTINVSGIWGDAYMSGGSVLALIGFAAIIFSLIHFASKKEKKAQ